MNGKLYSLLYVLAAAFLIALMAGYFQQAAPIHPAIAILSMPSESVGTTRSLARVYAEPNDSSQVVNVIPPEKQVHILGLNDTGAFIGISREDEATLAGWISTSEVKHNLVVATTCTLVKEYQRPDSSSPVTGTLSPAAEVQVLGRNSDNTFIAIAQPGAKTASVRWVKTSELSLPDVVAKTSTLTRLYQKPDSGSRVASVLPPAQSVILIGRSNDGTWFAVASLPGKKFIGWAQSNDLSGGMDRKVLPVLLPR